MDAIEKRFKIQKIEKYNEQLEEEKRKIIRDTIFVGFGIAAIALSVTHETDGFVLELIDKVVTITAAIASAFNLKNMIQAIVKKTSLESKIEDINFEEEISKYKERKGRK